MKENCESAFDLEIEVEKSESGLNENGIIHTDRIFTIDKSLCVNRAGSVSAQTTGRIEEGLVISLGLAEF